MGMQEFISYIPDFFKNFPNWNLLQFSTSFIGSNDILIIQQLINCIEEWTPHQFIIKMQISIDGTNELNDYNRGIGTTNKILSNINNLSIQANQVKLQITTNSILDKNTLYMINSYEDMKNWFEFYLNNFPEEIRFGLFRPAQSFEWNKEDGIQYAKLLTWANQWYNNNPIDRERFIWPFHKAKTLDLCAATAPHMQIAFSPQGEQCLCHRAVLEGLSNKEISKIQINLTYVFDLLMDYYYKYKDNISLDDYRESFYIYISNQWCPYNSKQSYYNILFALDLYYNGAMNILLEWSRQYGSS